MTALLLIAGSLIAEVEPPNFVAPTPVLYANRLDAGFVFIDGQYVRAPYTIVETDSYLAINGHAVECIMPPLGPGVTLTGPMLENTLASHGVLIMNRDEPLTQVNQGLESQSLLRSITSHETEIRMEAADAHPSAHWATWLRNFQPPTQLAARATRHLVRMRKVRQNTHDRVLGVQKQATMAYPLTVFGMLAGVWSLGHLLGSSPRPGEAAAYAKDPAMVRATSLSILAVIMLSGLDLVWTLLASHTGQMTELNPLGSTMIGNPIQLVAFKVIATAIGCGVLYRLRTNQKAGRAAWWLCLVLTILTFRWLVFTSMNICA